jgi:hypothetical protein
MRNKDFYSKESAPCLHAETHAPHEMHFFLSISSFFFLVNAPTGHASTHPTHAPPQVHEEHLPAFQQHFL